MRMLKLMILLPVLMLPLGGCVIAVNTDDMDSADWEDREQRNERAIRRMSLGRSAMSIESELGEADFEETFWREGEQFRVLFYRTQRMRGDGRTTRDETTPLVFIDGELVGWGESAIEHATRPTIVDNGNP